MLASINTAATVVADVEDASAAVDGAEENGNTPNNENEASDVPQPLCRSSRVKGYLLLLVSASLNFEAVLRLHRRQGYFVNTDVKDMNWCLVLSNPSSFLEFLVMYRLNSDSEIRYAMAASCITIIISSFILLCHLDLVTGLRKTLWPKMFGPNKKVELCILSFLVVLWLVTIWFNTTIKGIAGEGKEQYNLYFTSWLCLWIIFWTLERWFVSSGKSSFEQFVSSWPHRCPLWIVSFILSFSNFLFVLDAMNNWEEGTKANPYVNKMFANISQAEWQFFLDVNIMTFMKSLLWILVELFRRNKKEGSELKSDVENYIEGILLHLFAIMWIVLIFFVTMPGRSASLIGNLYFCSWSTCFSVLATLIWWLRDWRKDIADTISDQQAEYERAKRAALRREEKRMARVRIEHCDSEAVETEESNNLDDIVEEDGAEEDIVDDDITVSASISGGNRDRTDTTDSTDDQRTVCFSAKSLYVSARDQE